MVMMIQIVSMMLSSDSHPALQRRHDGVFLVIRETCTQLLVSIFYL